MMDLLQIRKMVTAIPNEMLFRIDGRLSKENWKYEISIKSLCSQKYIFTGLQESHIPTLVIKHATSQN